MYVHWIYVAHTHLFCTHWISFVGYKIGKSKKKKKKKKRTTCRILKTQSILLLLTTEFKEVRS